jgi:hypothetical protein
VCVVGNASFVYISVCRESGIVQRCRGESRVAKSSVNWCIVREDRSKTKWVYGSMCCGGDTLKLSVGAEGVQRCGGSVVAGSQRYTVRRRDVAWRARCEGTGGCAPLSRGCVGSTPHWFTF